MNCGQCKYWDSEAEWCAELECWMAKDEDACPFFDVEVPDANP